MIRSFARTLAVLCCLLLLPGCAVFKKRADAKRRAAMEKAVAEARQRPQFMGRVALVNAEERFVLIDSTSTQTPRAGVTWRTYSDGAASAELRATGVRRRPWVIADIVSGEPKAGDTVLQPAETESADAPRAEPAVAAAPETPAAPTEKPRSFWKRLSGRLGLGN